MTTRSVVESLAVSPPPPPSSTVVAISSQNQILNPHDGRYDDLYVYFRDGRRLATQASYAMRGKMGGGGDGRGAAGPLPRANVRPRRLPGAAADRSSKSLLIDRPTNYRHRLGRRAARDCRLRKALGDRSVAQIPRSALPTPRCPPQGEVR